MAEAKGLWRNVSQKWATHCNELREKGRTVKSRKQLPGKGHEENSVKTDEQGSQEVILLRGKKNYLQRKGHEVRKESPNGVC